MHVLGPDIHVTEEVFVQPDVAALRGTGRSRIILVDTENLDVPEGKLTLAAALCQFPEEGNGGVASAQAKLEETMGGVDPLTDYVGNLPACAVAVRADFRRNFLVTVENVTDLLFFHNFH